MANCSPIGPDVRVMYDMRAADVAAGGQGAPLVPVYHRALAASIPERPVAFVNIGGVANVTWIGADGELLAFDTGPGNALARRLGASPYRQRTDFDGRLALRGKGRRRASSRSSSAIHISRSRRRSRSIAMPLRGSI